MNTMLYKKLLFGFAAGVATLVPLNALNAQETNAGVEARSRVVPVHTVTYRNDGQQIPVEEVRWGRGYYRGPYSYYRGPYGFGYYGGPRYYAPRYYSGYRGYDRPYGGYYPRDYYYPPRYGYGPGYGRYYGGRYYGGGVRVGRGGVDVFWR